jgi:hypothetical protein
MTGREIPENAFEQKEYTAEDGISEAINLIEKLLESQEYVTVAVTGSCTDVGKTYISAGILSELDARGISKYTASEFDTLRFKPIFTDCHRKGHVLVFTAQNPIVIPGNEGIERQNDLFKDEMRKVGLPLSKIDLRVYVYRPDKPFHELIDLKNADILIRNNLANDKALKYKPLKNTGESMSRPVTEKPLIDESKIDTGEKFIAKYNAYINEGLTETEASDLASLERIESMGGKLAPREIEKKEFYLAKMNKNELI